MMNRGSICGSQALNRKSDRIALCLAIHSPISVYEIAVADPGGGGGGPGGPDPPPPFGPRCRLFNIGPKVGPPPFVNVQEWGCFSIFLRANDVTRTMSKGGGVRLWMSKSGGVFQIFWGRMTSHGQCPRGGGVLVKNPVSAPGPPPPFKNPGSAPG